MTCKGLNDVRHVATSTIVMMLQERSFALLKYIEAFVFVCMLTQFGTVGYRADQ